MWRRQASCDSGDMSEVSMIDLCTTLTEDSKILCDPLE